MAAAQDVLGPPPVMDSFFDDHIADYGPHPPESFFEHMMAEESTPGPPCGSSNWLVSPSYLNIQRESVYRDIHIRSCVYIYIYLSLHLYIYYYLFISCEESFHTHAGSLPWTFTYQSWLDVSETNPFKKKQSSTAAPTPPATYQSMVGYV